ncbi:MAG: PQQ-binding-like beta-propeller repeat protein [Pirellulales bacterium]
MSRPWLWLLVSLSWLASLGPSAARADDWPRWRGPTGDGVWRETGLVDRFSGPELTAQWRVPVGAGYSGPTVAAGRVYVMDRLTKPREVERVLCLDEQNGNILWNHTYDCSYGRVRYPAGPRACVTIDDGQAFSLGATGQACGFSAADGHLLWQRDLAADYAVEMPIWGLAASPLVVGDLVILHIGGTPGACVVALERTTGRERWHAVNDRAQYATPVLVRQGDRSVLVVWTGDAVVGLDPATGTEYWRDPFRPRNMPIGVATPVVAGDRLFCTSFYDGSLLLRLSQDRPQAQRLWHRVGRSETDTDALHSIIGTPLILDGHIYGVDSYGELRCLSLANGDRIWENLTATPKARWSTIHMVQNGDRTWMFNERGELLITRLTPQGFTELSRAKLLEPTLEQLNQRNGVCWSHPAFANRHIVARNDRELVRASLAAE